MKSILLDESQKLKVRKASITSTFKKGGQEFLTPLGVPIGAPNSVEAQPTGKSIRDAIHKKQDEDNSQKQLVLYSPPKAATHPIKDKAILTGALGAATHPIKDKAILAGALGAAGVATYAAHPNSPEKNKDTSPAIETQPTETLPVSVTSPSSWSDKILTGAKGAYETGKKYASHPDAAKYAGGATLALGAGLGAIALAKKLRNKKKAVKQEQSKK